jgi:ketosteroid isomerase-like protein
MIERNKLTIALMALLVAGTVYAAYSNQDNREQEVRLVFNRFITAFNNLDWDVFHNLLANEVTVFNPDIPEAPSVGRLDGREQVENGFKAVFAASKRQGNGPPYLHIVPKNVKIQMLGDTAIVSFEFDREGNSIGRRTILLHHESHDWKIVHIHASNVARRN